MVVTNTSTSLCYIFYTTLIRTLNVVAKWEESIRTECNTCVLSNPLLAFFTCQRLWTFCEELLPYTILQYIFILIRDVDIDCVISISTANILLKWEVYHLWTLAQPPFVSLATCQASTMDAALLSSSNTNRLSVLDIANRITLRVLQSNQRNDEITLSILGECLILCRHILEECWVIQFHFVTTLFKCNTEDLLLLDSCRNIVWVNLDNVVCALTLILQNF